MIGKRLSSYDILEEIGSGGMATVYRAYQPAVDRHVAIKVIQKHVSDDTNALQRFHREARLVTRLNHENILPVYDFDAMHDPPYIVMQYLESGTLKDLFSEGQLPPEESIYLVKQVAQALDYAHRQGVVHRDVKPSNIMFDQQGTPFVSDFGIARTNQATDDTDGGSITITGAIVGTPDYMAPEQALGNVIDHRVDVYSLAVILFRLLTGQLPYNSNAPMGVLLMHINDPVPSVSGLNRQLPTGIDDVIQRGMAKDPADRFATCSGLVKAAEAVLGISENPVALRDLAQASMKAIQTRTMETRALRSDSLSEEHNRVVTTLYANVAEYALLIEDERGGVAARDASENLIRMFEDLIETNGGEVYERTDDHITALWGAKTAREDDPERAIKAALAMQDAAWAVTQSTLEISTTFGAPPNDDDIQTVDIGINTGTVLLTPSNDGSSQSASGSTINMAQRLAANAHGNILVAHDAYRHVIGVFSFEQDVPIRQRGRRESVQVYRVTGVKSRVFRRETRGVEGVETHMVARDADMKHLQDAYFVALEDHETQAVTILGAPGLGKSRLLYEFSNWADLRPEEYRIFRGRATGEMVNRPYALIRDILAYRFELLDSDSPILVRAKLENGIASFLASANAREEANNIRMASEIAPFLGHLAGYDFSSSPQLSAILKDRQQLVARGRQMFIRLIEVISEHDPVVIQLEDIHLADDASLDLLNELMQHKSEMPLLLVMTARPALLERRPNWGSGQEWHTQIELHELSKRDARNLAREILKKMADVPKELRDFLVDRAEGNPYYMEELVKLLIEYRIIQKFDDAWQADASRLENIPVPPTLVALLQSRLDALLHPERVVLQRASVVGRIFWDNQVIALGDYDQADVDDVQHVLKTLVEREFIRIREMSSFAGSDEYIFVHSMMRDLIYDTMLTRQRLAYHRGVADWLIGNAGNRVAELAGLIADHYERAETNDLAAGFLIQYGFHALEVGGYQEAQSFMERALALLPDDGEVTVSRLMVYVRLAEAARNLGDYATAQSYLDPVLESTVTPEDDQIEARVLALCEAGQVASDSGRVEQAKNYLAQALPLARSMGDHHTLARVLYGLGDTAWLLGELDDARTYLQESLDSARSTGDQTQAMFALNRLAVVEAVSQNYDQAEALFQECYELALQVGNRERAGVVLGNLGELANLRGEHEEAREKLQEALEIARKVGQHYMVSIGLLNLASVNLRLGDHDEALRYLKELASSAHEHGTVALTLGGIIIYARLLAVQGEGKNATRLLTQVARHPAAHNDVQREVDLALEELDLTSLKQNTRIKDIDLDAVIQEIMGYEIKSQ